MEESGSVFDLSTGKLTNFKTLTKMLANLLSYDAAIVAYTQNRKVCILSFVVYDNNKNSDLRTK